MDKRTILSELLKIYNTYCPSMTDEESLLSDLYSLESARNTILMSYRLEEVTIGVRDGVDSMLMRKYKELNLKYFTLAKDRVLKAYYEDMENINPVLFISHLEAMLLEVYHIFVEPLLFSKKPLSEYAYGGTTIAEIEALKAKSKNSYYAYHDFILKLKKDNSYSISGIKKYINVELEKSENTVDIFEALTPAYVTLSELFYKEKRIKRYFTLRGIRTGFLLNRVGIRMRKSVENKDTLENGGFSRMVNKLKQEPSIAVRRIYSALSEIEMFIEDGVFNEPLPDNYREFIQSINVN